MKYKNKGFSIVEILVIISIIGILTQVVLTTVTIAREKAIKAKAQLQISRIELAIKEMALDTNKWPVNQRIGCTNSSGTNEVPDLNAVAGITNNAGSVYTNWDGPYMDSVPDDPWGRPYFLDTDYYVKNSDDSPCNNGNNYTGCSMVVVIGSLGKGETVININDYDADDVIKIISRTTCP